LDPPKVLLKSMRLVCAREEDDERRFKPHTLLILPKSGDT